MKTVLERVNEKREAVHSTLTGCGLEGAPSQFNSGHSNWDKGFSKDWDKGWSKDGHP